MYSIHETLGDIWNMNFHLQEFIHLNFAELTSDGTDFRSAKPFCCHVPCDSNIPLSPNAPHLRAKNHQMLDEGASIF